MLKLITGFKDYLLFVDTEPTGYKKGEWCYREEGNSEPLYQFTYNISKYPMGNKVIAHLLLNNAPKLEGVPPLPELPKQEEDVLGLKHLQKHLEWELSKNPNYTLENPQRVRDFTYGYKAASKKYSEEDLWNIIQLQYERFNGDFRRDLFENTLKVYNQSLSPTLIPKEFIPEYENFSLNEDGYSGDVVPVSLPDKTVLKVVNGVLQGTYKF